VEASAGVWQLQCPRPASPGRACASVACNSRTASAAEYKVVARDGGQAGCRGEQLPPAGEAPSGPTGACHTTIAHTVHRGTAVWVSREGAWDKTTPLPALPPPPRPPWPQSRKTAGAAAPSPRFAHTSVGRLTSSHMAEDAQGRDALRLLNDCSARCSSCSLPAIGSLLGAQKGSRRPRAARPFAVACMPQCYPMKKHAAVQVKGSGGEGRTISWQRIPHTPPRRSDHTPTPLTPHPTPHVPPH
jgi:hypothetical protein